MLLSRVVTFISTTTLLVANHVTSGFSPCAFKTNGIGVMSYRFSARQNSRRSFVEQAGAASVASLLGTVVMPQQVVASGGATAGGAYLLSAKQRYNERIKEGVKGFLAAGSSLEKEDIDAVRAFFTNEDTGTWKDFSTAGFLLANAFRRNSTAAPDSLPAVKKWKTYAAQVEAMTKALKKKDTEGGLSAYRASLLALDEYLAQVELPSAKEIAAS